MTQRHYWFVKHSAMDKVVHSVFFASRCKFLTSIKSSKSPYLFKRLVLLEKDHNRPFNNQKVLSSECTLGMIGDVG